MLNLKSSILILAAFGAIFSSCKKNDPSPGPSQLSTSEAITTLTSSGAQFKTDSTSFVQSTLTVSSSLSSLNNSGIPSNLGATFTSLRFEAEKDGAVFSSISSQLSALAFDALAKNLAGGRIPNTFDAAKGIWELQTITSSSYVLGYSYCSSNKYVKKDFVKTGTSDKIVIKYSSNFYNYNYCSSSPNNAVYTISNLVTKPVTYSICINGIKNTRTDTIATSLDATLNVDGKDVMTYNYSSTVTDNYNGYPSNYSIYMKVGNYEYSAKSNVATNYSTGDFESGWKKDGSTIYGYNASISGDGSYVPANLCSSTSSNLSNSLLFLTLNRYWLEYIRSNVKLSGELNPKGYLKDVVAKYGTPNTTGYYDTTTYKSILNDTTLTDKYYSFALYQTADGAKIGDLKLRLYRYTYSYSTYYTYSYLTAAWYIYYKDGTKELITNKLYKSGYFYTPILVYTAN